MFALVAQLERRIGHAAAVVDGGRLQDIAKLVDFERDGVIDARVVRIAFVVIVDRFARMSEKHCVAILALRLDHLDSEILFGDCVRMNLTAGAVESIDFLAQH